MKVLGSVKRLEPKKNNGGRVAADLLSFGSWGSERETVIIVACAGWESGKPVFGFPFFQAAHALAVEM